MKVWSLHSLKKNEVTNFFVEHWGSPEMVLSTGIYHCDQLDGFAMVDDDGGIAGLITYSIEGSECEIVSLDSLLENKGIGSSLVSAAEEAAKTTGCNKMKLITTNDNIHALRFYQRRGYRLAEIFPNAVEAARKRKPEIPLIAENGIPIRDEILLVKSI
ncbi:GNAT family N-acetyltransferase [Falsibacillus pallidus]|uniref:Acetyltransferase (GNAT) family protein n=1 Tax=Falsibacillus pallidus TaxID=493781 RepID=A0A370G9Q3_9BACI|nr:GNAT family N-acetyltransferase [Falsibacillus pallidus]RDI39930.1 acetyltransferase (GNAT) family protein [Falsibacillus pallidus]